MSDYFLNKIYDSLLVNKTPKIKSTFRTLSESYQTIYEEEPNQQLISNQNTNQLTTNQTTNQKEEPKPQTDIQINISQPILQTVKWVGEQQRLYDAYANKSDDDESKTGVGPGEYAIASVISGLTEVADLNTFISGQSESFDVSWPSKDKAEYKFEVKKEEGSSVRIGKLGHEMGGYIQNVVLRVATTLRDEYNRLSEDAKLNVDDTIRSNMSRVQGTRKAKGGGYLAPEKERKEKMDSLIDNWSILGFVNAITGNLIELPKNMLFGAPKNPNYTIYGTDYRYRPGKKEGSSAERSQYLILSLKRVLEIIERIASSGQEIASKKAQDLATTFKQFYNAPGTEKGKEFMQYLDREAEKTDRRLSKELCKATGEGCKDLANFFTTIKQEGLYQSIVEAEEYINNPSNVRNLFPSTITGLFVVKSKGWQYVPADKIGQYVRVTTISQGKPKIALYGTPTQDE